MPGRAPYHINRATTGVEAATNGTATVKAARQEAIIPPPETMSVNQQVSTAYRIHFHTNKANPPIGRRLTFLKKLGNIDTRPLTFGNSVRIQTWVCSVTISRKNFKRNQILKRGKCIGQAGNRWIIAKMCNLTSPIVSMPFSKQSSSRTEKGKGSDHFLSISDNWTRFCRTNISKWKVSTW